jgi:hypothetical protein
MRQAPEFICAGCGQRIQLRAGNPRQSPYVWRNATTDQPAAYCYDCDDALIQDAPLPRQRPAQGQARHRQEN